MFSLEMDDNSDVKGSCVNPNPEICNRISTFRQPAKTSAKSEDLGLRNPIDASIRSDPIVESFSSANVS